MSRILLLDDSMTIIKVVKLTFASIPGCEVDVSKLEEDARKKITTKGFDAVICYARICGDKTIEFLLDVQQYTSNILILTESTGTTKEFEEIGVRNFLKKPFNSDELRSLVQEMIEAPRPLSDDDRQGAHEFGEHSNEPTRSIPKRNIGINESTVIKPPPPPLSGGKAPEKPKPPMPLQKLDNPQPFISMKPGGLPQGIREKLNEFSSQPTLRPSTAEDTQLEPSRETIGVPAALENRASPISSGLGNKPQNGGPALTLDMGNLERTIREAQIKKASAPERQEARSLPVKKISMVSSALQEPLQVAPEVAPAVALAVAPTGSNAAAGNISPAGSIAADTQNEATVLARFTSETVLSEVAQFSVIQKEQDTVITKNMKLGLAAPEAKESVQQTNAPNPQAAQQLHTHLLGVLSRDIEKMQSTLEAQLKSQVQEQFHAESLERMTQVLRPLLQDEVRKWVESAGVEIAKNIVREEINKLVAE